jgi:hypothetical protein
MDRLARFFLNSPADIHALWATIRLGCEMGDIRMNNQLVSLSPLDVPGGFLEENMGPFTENGNDRSLALALGVWLIRLRASCEDVILMCAFARRWTADHELAPLDLSNA